MKDGQPSETALRVAGARVCAAHDPLLRSLLPAPEEPYTANSIRAHSARARMLMRLWSFGPTRRALNRLTETAFPGALLHILLRKRFVADQVRSALEAGREQVIVLGAGLDPLCALLAPDFPHVTFFEIDHPATQDVKRRGLEPWVTRLSRLRFVPVDFARETMEDCLRRTPGFLVGAPSVLVAEGLLMYLDDPDVDRVFETARRVSGPGSRFLFSTVDRQCLNRPGDPVARFARLLERVGEPIRSSQFARDLPGFSARRGFHCREVVDAAGLQQRYLKPLELERTVMEGELLVVSEKSR